MPLTGLDFDQEIKFIEDHDSAANTDPKKKGPLKRIPSAKKKAPNAKKVASEATFFKSIYYVVRFFWPKEDDKDELSMFESELIYLPDPDPKTNSKTVSAEFKDSYEFSFTEKSVGVKHHLESKFSNFHYNSPAKSQ